MNKITLFTYQDSHIGITIKLYFNKNDQLIFYGRDTGEKVYSVFGKSEYDYAYTIEPDAVKKLALLFKIKSNNKKALLVAVKKRFHTNTAYSEFGAFMKENGIPLEQFTF
jgi:hypothetical protein